MQRVSARYRYGRYNSVHVEGEQYKFIFHDYDTDSFCDQFEPRAFLQLAQDYRATHLHMAPPVAVILAVSRHDCVIVYAMYPKSYLTCRNRLCSMAMT